MIIFYSRQYLVQFHRAYLLPFGVGMLLLRRSHPSGKQPWGTAGLESTQVAQPGRPTRSPNQVISGYPQAGNFAGPNDRIIVYIKATFNNTLLTLTNFQGQVLTWASAGSCGFKGTRKGTPFAAKKVVEIFLKKSNNYFSRCNQIKIFVYGIGPGRENALRGLGKIGDKTLSKKITLIREMTKIPHNGCRPPKKRRL